MWHTEIVPFITGNTPRMFAHTIDTEPDQVDTRTLIKINGRREIDAIGPFKTIMGTITYRVIKSAPFHRKSMKQTNFHTFSSVWCQLCLQLFFPLPIMHILHWAWSITHIQFYCSVNDGCSLFHQGQWDDPHKNLPDLAYNTRHDYSLYNSVSWILTVILHSKASSETVKN